VRAAALAAGALLGAALVLVLVGVTAGPLTRTCAPGLSEAACDGAVGAVMRRGLPAAHPLILAAHVRPGAAPEPEAHGHRATVVLELLAPIPPVGIELHFDQGGHWGGVSERPALELAAWASAPLVAAAVVAGGLLGLALRRRGQTPR
jgi:hypothetical protein